MCAWDASIILLDYPRTLNTTICQFHIAHILKISVHIGRHFEIRHVFTHKNGMCHDVSSHYFWHTFDTDCKMY